MQSSVLSFIQHIHRADATGAGRRGHETGLAVAVSGGVDSTVLLHILTSIAKDASLTLLAVHVNHHLRPTSNRDEAFVKDICERWGIPCEVRHISLTDIPVSDRRGTEADARRLRYVAISDAARVHGIHRVALAHHADDQVETVLWRLMRGTSLTGLAGIRPMTDRDNTHWIRPLLRFDKSALAAYAAEHALPHVDDESNEDESYARNYLRLHVVPQLKRVQPGLNQAVRHLTETLQEEDAFLEAQAQAVFTDCVKSVKGGFYVDLTRFRGVARPLQRRVIKIILYCLTSTEWTSSHIERILSLLETSQPSAEVHLPGAVRAQREYDGLRVGEFPPVARDIYYIRWYLEDSDTLEVPVSANDRWVFSAAFVPAPVGGKASSQFELYLPAVRDVVIRPPQRGERIKLLGLNGSKKTQDIFVDAKVPKADRLVWPVLTVEDQAVWLPGLVRGQSHLVSQGDEAVWHIKAVRCQADVIDAPFV